MSSQYITTVTLTA